MPSARIEQRISYCRICPALCGIVVDVDLDTETVMAVRGDTEHPLSQGFTCPKGRALPEEVNAPDRLHASWRRQSDGSRHPLPSSAALDEIANRLGEIIERHGPRSVALYVGTRGYEVLALRSATAWLNGIGSPSLYSTYTIDQPGKDLARALHGSWSAGFQPATTSDVLMFVGNNPLVSATTSYVSFPTSNMRVELRRMRDAGLKVIVVDPRRTETAAWADVHLAPAPGTDAPVLAGMIRHILTTGRFDTDFVARHARGLDELRLAVGPFTPHHVQSLSGVPAADLVRAAELFAQGPRGCAIGGTGLNMAPHPVLNEYLLLCLNTLCGRYVRAGERVTNPGTLTQGRRPIADVRGPRPIWGRGPQPRVRDLTTMYDQMPASALADEILTPGDGQIRALVVSGGNPAVALPDQTRVLAALRSLDLLVCLDVRDTQTTALADYVVACKLSLEKADTTLAHDLRFARPFAQVTDAVVEPAGDLLEEWEVFQGLAERMGSPWDLTGRVGMPIPLDIDAPTKPPRNSAELWALLCSGGRVPLDDIRRHPHGLVDSITDEVIVSPPDAPSGDRFQLADRALMAELATTVVPTADPDFPMRLISRRMWEYHNSWGQDIESVRRRWGANPAFVNRADLEQLGLDDGDEVEVSSRRGSIIATARIAEDIPPGVVSMAHCWGGIEPDDEPLDVGASSNRLVDAASDLSQYVGMARQSAIPIRLCPVSSAQLH